MYERMTLPGNPAVYTWLKAKAGNTLPFSVLLFQVVHIVIETRGHMPPYNGLK